MAEEERHSALGVLGRARPVQAAELLLRMVFYKSVANRSRPRGRLAVDVTSSSRRSRKMSEDRLYRIDIYDERAEARPSNGLNYMKAPKAAVR